MMRKFLTLRERLLARLFAQNNSYLDTSPGGALSAFLQEDGTSAILLEDGSSDLLLEG